MKRFTLTDSRLHQMRMWDSCMTRDPAVAIVLGRAGDETAAGDYELVDGEWQRTGPQPADEWIAAALQLLSLLLEREGTPYEQPADPSWQDPENQSWADEARRLVHYAVEGSLDWEYVKLRLGELGPYVPPSALCNDCGQELNLLDREQLRAPARLCHRCV